MDFSILLFAILSFQVNTNATLSYVVITLKFWDSKKLSLQQKYPSFCNYAGGFWYMWLVNTIESRQAENYYSIWKTADINFFFPLYDCQPVRRGTNGGVTKAGLLAAAAAGSVIGLSFVLLGLLTVKCDSDIAIKQLLVIPISTLAGLCGSVIDSLLGATLQFSGFCTVRNKVNLVTPPRKYTYSLLA